MEQVTTLFPPAFPALALAHFMALLSPGPDFFLLVGYAGCAAASGCASALRREMGSIFCWW